jgi:hypothetical protein
MFFHLLFFNNQGAGYTNRKTTVLVWQGIWEPTKSKTYHSGFFFGLLIKATKQNNQAMCIISGIYRPGTFRHILAQFQLILLLNPTIDIKSTSFLTSEGLIFVLGKGVTLFWGNLCSCKT